MESASVLRDQGVKDLPKLVEAETMLYFILEEGSAGVMITGFKKGMGVAALPGTATPEVLPKLRES